MTWMLLSACVAQEVANAMETVSGIPIRCPILVGRAAELSALLEDEHGRDPFSAGEMPQTVGEIEAFYASVA